MTGNPSNIRTQLHGPTRARRIPGPPPPRSWLQDSQHAYRLGGSEGRGASFLSLRWRGARIQQQSSELPSGYFPRARSLEHYALKAIAMRWPWHAEYDHVYLATLPVRTRCALLSYIAIYNDGHWPDPLPFLFPLDGEPSDADEVVRLDLANAIGGWATVRKIEQHLIVKAQQRVIVKKTEESQQGIDSVPDSWDDDPVQQSPGPLASPSTSSRLPKSLNADYLRFSNLRHLSLAVDSTSPSAAASASWSQLISLSVHLAPLTSLSLAHWPAPTYMPNASQAIVKIQNPIPNAPDIVYNATDPYTGFDNNWREAAGILRSLSRNLYCLTWLDLSGCAPWLSALCWIDPTNEPFGVDWNGAWRNITKLNFSVGWLPGRPSRFDSDTSSVSRSTSSIDSTRAIEQLYGESEAIRHSLQELAKLRLGPGPAITADVENQTPLPGQSPGQQWNVEEEREKTYFRRDIERYQSSQRSARHVAKDIRALRKSAGGAWIDFEFGDVLTEEQMNI